VIYLIFAINVMKKYSQKNQKIHKKSSFSPSRCRWAGILRAYSPKKFEV